MKLLAQYTTYMLALALAAFLPGPGMTGLMFKTLSQGYKNGWMMLLGLITGDIIFLLISIFCIAGLVQINPNFSFYLMVLSSFYLLYLSKKFWFFNGNLLKIPTEIKVKEIFSSYRDGVVMTLSNPKTIAFYLALVPSIFTPKTLENSGFILVLLTILVLMVVGGLYILCAWQLKGKLQNLRLQGILLKCFSLFMCFLALSILYRELTIFEVI